MSNLLMISGDRSLAEGKRGAFYNTLEEFSKHWDHIDIICPPIYGSKINILNLFRNSKLEIKNYFHNVKVHPSPWPLILQPLWIYREGLRILKNGKWKMANEKWVMTVHEYPPFYNGIGAKLLWAKIKVPYVLEIMHVPGHPRAADLKEKIYKQAVRLFIKFDARKAVKVRVINRQQIPEFLTRAGVPADKILYIPAFYIDLDIFRPRAVEKKYDLVFAARLEKNKGILNLIEAIRIAKKQKPDIRLLIIGSGPELSRIKLLTTHYKLQTNIIFSGWLETLNDVARAYNSAKIFINPSLNEGGPRVVLEAMACGLPVITTRVGVVLDIIKDGESGLFTGWEPEDIADKISYLLGNQELQQKLSQAGFGLAQGFKKEAAVRNYAQQLQKLI